MSSQSQSQSQDASTRYAHLLEPIRDLASNWHIDIASELEEYLADLEAIRIHFAPGTQQLLAGEDSQGFSQGVSQSQGGTGGGLNFAQAALLIQGSACIYSKKVEYLYALLYQTLDVIKDRRAGRDGSESQRVGSSIDPQTGEDADAAMLVDAGNDQPLLSLDDTLAAAEVPDDGSGSGSKIDLDEGDMDQIDDPLNVNPRGSDASMLFDPYGNNVGMGMGKRAASTMIRAPLSLLSDGIGLGGGGSSANTEPHSSGLNGASSQPVASQFKISQCLLHRSGALLLEEKEMHLLRNDDRFEFDVEALKRMGLYVGDLSAFASSGSASKVQQSPAAPLPFGSPRGMFLQGIAEEAEQGPNDEDAAARALQFDDFGGGMPMGFDDDDDDHGEREEKYPTAPASALKKSVRFEDGTNPFDDDDDENDADAGAHNTTDTSTAGRSSSSTRSSFEELWAQLDPHTAPPANGLPPPRPYRRGHTTRKPRLPSLPPHMLNAPMLGMVDGAASSNIGAHLLHAWQHSNPAQAIILRGIAKQSINAPFWAEFSILFLRAEQERKRKRRRSAMVRKNAASKAYKDGKAGRKQETSAASNDLASAGAGLSEALSLHDQDDDDGDDGWGVGGMDGPDGINFAMDDPLFAGGAAAALGEEAAEIDQWSGVPAQPSVPSSVSLDAELAGVSASYESLCKDHVAAYLRSAEQYLASSTLSARVSSWAERIQPLLEEEESHAPFDIKMYGREILQTIQQKTEEKEEKVVDFADAVHNQPRYEVCRLFLAALQLANNGNVDIRPSHLSDHPDAASMALQLLSMEDRSFEQLSDEQMTMAMTLPPNSTQEMTENKSTGEAIESVVSASSRARAKKKATTAAAASSKQSQSSMTSTADLPTAMGDENMMPNVTTTTTKSEQMETDDGQPNKNTTRRDNKAAPLSALAPSDLNRRSTRTRTRT